MVHPVLVYHPQQHHTLHLAHDRGGELLLLLFVEVGSGGGKGVDDLLRRQLGDALRLEAHGVPGEVQALHLTQQLPHSGLVHVALAAEGAADLMADGGGHHVHDDALDVHALQHLLALIIDDLTLLVHHVVVLQHRLTGLEVPGLHRGLSLLNGTGQHLVLNGGILVEVHPLHDGVDALTTEQTHEVILQRDIEPGLAGVALTTGTATQLVVDPAGVVALGTHDEQAAGLTHLLRLSGDLLLVLLQLLGKQAAGIQNLLVVRLGVAGGLSNELVRQPRLPQVAGGHVLGIAAQHDIRTTAGHVGGHGDGAQLTGLRHDLRLTLMVLGVQYVVLDARLGEHPA